MKINKPQLTKIIQEEVSRFIKLEEEKAFYASGDRATLIKAGNDIVTIQRMANKYFPRQKTKSLKQRLVLDLIEKCRKIQNDVKYYIANHPKKPDIQEIGNRLIQSIDEMITHWKNKAGLIT